MPFKLIYVCVLGEASVIKWIAMCMYVSNIIACPVVPMKICDISDRSSAPVCVRHIPSPSQPSHP